MMQLPLIAPESNWRPPRISELPSWSGAKRIALDIETCDPTLKELGPGVRRGAYIAGYSFAIEDGPKYYAPLRHEGGDNVEDPAAALGYLRTEAASFTGEIVGANLSYDLDFLLHVGIHFPQVKMFRDVQIAEPLIWEFAKSYSLESLCQKYLGVGKNEGMLREAAVAYGINPKAGLHLLPARFVGEYALADAALPLMVLRRQEKTIEEEDLWNIYNMESELLPVLVRMRQRGVRFSLSRLEKVEEWSAQEERKALGVVRDLTGVEIPFNSVWQAAALVPALLKIDCKIPLTPRTKKPSIDKAFLASIKHPVAEAIARARRVNKIRTTFCNSVREHAIGDRLHCTFTQLRFSEDEDADGEGQGARYGRVSCSHPNLQQQPARDPEIGPLWRAIYIPEEGELWCSADFSSQEPRQAVHYACKVKLGNTKIDDKWVDADKSAREVAEKYRSDRKMDPHQMLADIIMGRHADKNERSMAKQIFLGLCYGMGGAKLCHSLGFPTIRAVRDPLTKKPIDATSERGKEVIKGGGRIFESSGEEGQRLLDQFDKQVPFVRALSRIVERAANQYGYIRTDAGRKCRFPKDEDGNLMWTYKATNRLIQGSAADQTKISLIELDKEGFFLTLQIHDEITASVKDVAEAKVIGKIMEEAYKLNIPNKVDCDVGESWGEAKEIA